MVASTAIDEERSHAPEGPCQPTPVLATLNVLVLNPVHDRAVDVVAAQRCVTVRGHHLSRSARLRDGACGKEDDMNLGSQGSQLERDLRR